MLGFCRSRLRKPALSSSASEPAGDTAAPRVPEPSTTRRCCKSLQPRLRCLLAPRHASHATFWGDMGEFSHESASWQGNHNRLAPSTAVVPGALCGAALPRRGAACNRCHAFFACIFRLYAQVSACPHPAGGEREGAPCSSRQLCLPRRVPTGQGPAAPPEAAPPRDEAVRPRGERALRWGTAVTGSFLAAQMDRWTAELCPGHSPNPFLTLVTQGRGMPGAAHPCGRDAWKRQAQQPFCPGFTRAQRRGGRRGKALESEKQPL